jgi:hypothetical protein
MIVRPDRFGLFTSPAPLAVGETNTFDKKLGKIITLSNR